VPLDGKTEVVFRAHKSKRSLNQNNLLWEYYTIIGNEIGYVPEDLHEMVKAKIFGTKELKTKTLDGKPVTLTVPNGTTTKLDTKQMTEFLEAVEMLAGELGIVLPSPAYYGLEV
jgi:hypothetical protein